MGSKGAKAPAKVSSSSKAAETVAETTPAVEKSPEVIVTVYEMAFTEGDPVMSKWPGTNLYFKSKVTFVRDEDNEYDVQYEDGTIFTLKAKDVKKQITVPTKRPARSRSRGRSPGRKGRSRKVVDQSPDTSPEVKPKATPKPKTPKPKVEPPTPTRQSARIAEKAAL